jgi:predicted NBD/HSP70 family sugar kinase
MPNVIGIDIGGTKITGVAFNGRKVVRELTIVTPKSVKDFKFSIGRLVKFLSAGKKISGLGIGQPGVINPKTG